MSQVSVVSEAISPDSPIFGASGSVGSAQPPGVPVSVSPVSPVVVSADVGESVVLDVLTVVLAVSPPVVPELLDSASVGSLQPAASNRHAKWVGTMCRRFMSM